MAIAVSSGCWKAGVSSRVEEMVGWLEELAWFSWVLEVCVVSKVLSSMWDVLVMEAIVMETQSPHFLETKCFIQYLEEAYISCHCFLKADRL